MNSVARREAAKVAALVGTEVREVVGVFDDTLCSCDTARCTYCEDRLAAIREIWSKQPGANGDLFAGCATEDALAGRADEYSTRQVEMLR